MSLWEKIELPGSWLWPHLHQSRSCTLDQEDEHGSLGQMSEKKRKTISDLSSN